MVTRKAVDADELLRRVGDLAPLIRKHAPEAERNRCLSAAVVDAMREADLYTMARPKAYGGLELDPVSSFRVVEEVARYDSAAGWNLNLSTAGDYIPAWLPDDGAEEILSTQRLVFGASFNPNPGGAVAVDGGYRVNGQWRFVSGCQQAAWFLLLCPLMDGDKPVLDEQANPKMLFVFLPAAQVTIMDTWYTLGLRGTGSHNIEITDQFVPDRRAAALAPLEQAGFGVHRPAVPPHDLATDRVARGPWRSASHGRPSMTSSPWRAERRRASPARLWPTARSSNVRSRRPTRTSGPAEHSCTRCSGTPGTWPCATLRSSSTASW